MCRRHVGVSTPGVQEMAAPVRLTYVGVDGVWLRLSGARREAIPLH